MFESLPRRAAAATGAAALGLSLLAIAPASAAPARGALYAANGMVGVAEQILVNAPNLRGQVVTIGFANGPLGAQAQTTIGSNGWGALTWTPTAPGTWQVNGLGSAVSLTSDTFTVAAVPTSTVIVAPNNVQQGVATTLNVFVTSQGGTLAPQGTVSITSTFGSPVGSAALTPYAGFNSTNVSLATLTWTPSAVPGPYAMQATFTPSSAAWGASQSQVATPNIQLSNPIVSLRFAPNLYVGQPTYLSILLGQGYGDGTAAFIVNNQTVAPGSVPVTNGTAIVPWTPSVSGNATIIAQYTGKNGLSGQSSQAVNIQGALPQDNITVDPPNQPVWSQGRAIIMPAGSSVELVGSSSSGNPVLFSEQGPCAVSGGTLLALSAGSCTVSAQSFGSPTFLPATENYVVTVTAPPRKRR